MATCACDWGWMPDGARCASHFRGQPSRDDIDRWVMLEDASPHPRAAWLEARAREAVPVGPGLDVKVDGTRVVFRRPIYGETWRADTHLTGGSEKNFLSSFMTSGGSFLSSFLSSPARRFAGRPPFDFRRNETVASSPRPAAPRPVRPLVTNEAPPTSSARHPAAAKTGPPRPTATAPAPASPRPDTKSIGLAQGTILNVAGVTAISWSVIDGDTVAPGINPLIMPVPGAGTFHDCVAAHPSLLWSGNAAQRRARLYFKAEDDVAAPSLPYTGVGSVLVDFFTGGGANAGLPKPFAAAPVLEVPVNEVFGYSNVSQLDTGEFYMLVQKRMVDDPLTVLNEATKYALWDASSLTETGGWALSASPAMTPMQYNIPWALTELYTPDLFCDNPNEVHAWVGGKTAGPGGTLVDAGFSEAISYDDGVSWTLSSTQEIAWTDPNAFRHIETVAYDDGSLQHLMFYSQKNAVTGLPEIGYGHTEAVPSFTAAQVLDSRCP